MYTYSVNYKNKAKNEILQPSVDFAFKRRKYTQEWIFGVEVVRVSSK